MKKRNLLKGLVIGGVSTTALPNSWVKPVINSILLPAHAQTSRSTTLTIPGFSRTSSNGRDIEEALYFQINDLTRNTSGGTLAQVAAQTNPETIRVSKYVFEQQGLETSTTSGAKITVNNQRENHYVDSTFDDPAQDPNATGQTIITTINVPASISMKVISLSGNMWQLSYSVSLTATEEITFSNLSITLL